MGAAHQTTLTTSVVFEGVGLHSGSKCHISVHPAVENTGIVFRRVDIEAKASSGFDPSFDHRVIEAQAENVVRSDHGTTLANAYGVSVDTVEHLMAAFALLSIDNVRIDVTGPELPILDGSAAQFVREMREAGLTAQSAPRKAYIINQPIRIESGERSIEITPADKLSIEIEIEFEDCLIGRQTLSLSLEDPLEVDRIANSRTFCRLYEVDALRRAGLGRGGSLENSIVVNGSELVNEGRLRDPQEFVLHKALDLIGDLYLLGGPVIGAIRADKPGHELNRRAALAIANQVASPVATQVDGLNLNENAIEAKAALA